MAIFVPLPRALREIDRKIVDVEVRRRLLREEQRDLCKRLAETMIEIAGLELDRDLLLERRTAEAARLAAT